MKHISAVMGNLKTKKYTKKFAWYPIKTTSGEWYWLKDYYIVVQTWAPAVTEDGEVYNRRVISTYEFILEHFNQNSG
tara:strand:- start:1416 stop:1646 length:231 start_codon:yes stop_codon:yes gene_type:complete